MAAGSSRLYVKVVLVAAGYAAALSIAVAVVAIRVSETSGPVAQASSGMYAFADLLTFLAVFGACSVLPTGLGVYFLRRTNYFWPVVVVVGVGSFLAIASLALFILAIAGT